MTRSHRVLLGVGMMLTAGQTVLIAFYCFLLAPLFAGGLGPEDEVSSSGDYLVVCAMAFGAFAVVTNVWSCRGMVRALKNGISTGRTLPAACAVQVPVVACAVVVGWLTAAIAAAALLLLLLVCQGLDRRTFR
ncbi:hypothetical protein [Streptomyces syringium]|uniref:hypothetical protein n=1 Tax=Streptomyces syringium TaxID=76729 RepID=UPI0033F6762B